MDPVSSPIDQSPPPPEHPEQSELPELAEGPESGDRVSVTDAHGTIARFEMAYSPVEGDKFSFGPPLRQRIPSFFFLAFAGAMVAFVFIVQAGPSTSRFYAWIVEGDRGRPMSAQTLSFIVLASAIGTIIRAQMRGVVVRADGVEARYLLPMGLPRVRRWAWSQIERIVLDDSQVMFELWNGQYERLPPVRDPAKMGDLLERIASARHIRLTRLTTLPDVRR
jgi:hypothetical protein